LKGQSPTRLMRIKDASHRPRGLHQLIVEFSGVW
jgi:hypothetical protein